MSLLYYDSMYQVGDKLSRDYDHWQTDSKRILLTSTKERSALSIEHNRICMETDVPLAAHVHENRFERAWKEYEAKIKVEKFFRMGFRMQSMIPVDFKFAELAALTYGKLLSTTSELSNIIGKELQDYMFNVITKKEGYTLHLVCGPVKKGEISNWYNSAKLILDEEEKPPEIEYPEVAFLMDYDCYVQEPKSETAQTFYKEGAKVTRSASQDLAQYLFS